MVFPRKPRPTQTTPTDPRADLVRMLAQGGKAVASACGTCGATVREDDPEAVQTTVEVMRRRRGLMPYAEDVRSWRYHGVCFAALGRSGKVGDRGGPAALLALALDPAARLIRVTQAHYDVAQRLGAPLAYSEKEDSSSTDRGRAAWRHIPRAELAELRAAVEQRHQELTVPVPHESGWPCQVCGRSHDLRDAWDRHKDRPLCGACSKLVERSSISGNPRLEAYAFEEARDLIPPRCDSVTWGVLGRELPLARDMPGYSRHDFKVSAEVPERAPWAYVADLPEMPLSEEERQEARLAELEKRLAEVAG